MVLIAIVWIILFFLCFGIGNVVYEWPFVRTKKEDQYHFSLFESVLVGYALLISILSVYSFFLPINHYAWILCGSLGIFTWIFLLYRFFSSQQKRKQVFLLDWKKALLFVFFFVSCCFFVAFATARQTQWYDTLLYHFNAVNWMTQYSIVPGLANLEARFGMSSSFFLFAGLVNSYWLGGQGIHIALSFLGIVFIFEWLKIMIVGGNSIEERLFCFFTFPFLLMKATSTEVASFSTDFALSLFALGFIKTVLGDRNTSLCMMLVIGALAMTTKLSGSVMMVSAGICFFFFVMRNVFAPRSLKGKVGIFAFGISGFLIGSMIVRNVILSGWPFYPMPLLALPFWWKMPKAHVVGILSAIKGWARLPGAGYMDSLSFGIWYWLIPWYKRFFGSLEWYLLIGSLFGFASWLYRVGIKGKDLINRRTFLISFCTIIGSLLLWFYSAPDIRFGSVFFWMLFAVCAIPIGKIYAVRNEGYAIAALSAIATVVMIGKGFLIDTTPEFFRIEPASKSFIGKDIQGKVWEGITVYQPISGDLCGNAPLPCTSTLLPLLHLKKQGDMSKGFMITDGVE